MANMSFTNILTKSIGAVGLGLVLYDAHRAGKHESHVFDKELKTDSLTGHYFEDMKLDSNSVVKQEMKKKVFAYHMDENISGVYNNFKGYMEGFSSILVNNAVPFILSLGTVLLPGKASKFFGAGLLAYGGLYFLREGLGIGKAHE